MNDKVRKAIEELKDSIDADSLINEYNRLANKIAESTELNELESKLKELQKQLVDTLDKNLNDMYEQVKKQYEELKELYEKHPLISNYKVLKEEVNNLLIQINNNLKNI